MFFLLLFFLSSQQQPTYTTVFTTADKITFHYQKEGQKLNAPSVKDTSIKFTMNAQMYQAESYAPVGLYVERGKQVSKKIIINNSSTNFGITPQMVFYISKNGKVGMTVVKDANPSSYQWAVELSPQLIHNGEVASRIRGINRKLRRNAIGIKKDGTVVLVCSNERVGMQQLAEYLKLVGCTEAAYVDGAVSKWWKPGMEANNSFGVIIAVH
jgi:uncharacterized protein YigE (DUF2233 family)